MTERDSYAVRLSLLLLRAYKLLVSPLFAGSCRYLPSCSDYAADAIRIHGLPRGVLLAAGRLSRCHPWGGSGLDPVPPPGAGGQPHRMGRLPRSAPGR